MAIIIEDALAKRSTGTLSKQERPLTVGALEQALLASYPAEDAEEWDRTGITVLLGENAYFWNAEDAILDLLSAEIAE